MQFDGHGLEVRQGAPAIGEHTNEVFHELGIDDAEIARLRGAGTAEVTGARATDDLGCRAQLPRSRGRNRTPVTRRTDVVREITEPVIAPGEPIVVPPHVHQPDYEGELAVVIGRQARDVREADALDVVAGVTIGHDVSSRDHQYTTGQWSWSKSFDTFCPLGPEVVSLDEIDLAGGSRSTVSGEVLQSSNTSQLVFSVPYLIAWISQGCTLEPGDVILTGTPGGVGAARTPPRWLVDGDVVEITIEGLGREQPGRTTRERGARSGRKVNS